jgi:hypothetical protein
MTIRSFDRPTVRTLREEIESALRPLCEKHGLSLEVGRANFDYQSLTFKVQLAVAGEEGVAMTREAQDFKLLAPQLGLSPDDLGREITAGGNQYKILGYRRLARKTPIIVERQPDGKQFVMTVEQVVGAIKMEG